MLRHTQIPADGCPAQLHLCLVRLRHEVDRNGEVIEGFGRPMLEQEELAETKVGLTIFGILLDSLSVLQCGVVVLALLDKLPAFLEIVFFSARSPAAC